MIKKAYMCTLCGKAALDKQTIARHIETCPGDLEQITATVIYNTTATRPREIPFDQLTQKDKEHVITKILTDNTFHFTQDPRQHVKRKMSIVQYIESNDKKGVRLFEDESTIDDVFIKLARLNGCDLTRQKHMPYVWRINDTGICMFRDGYITKLSTMDSVKELMMSSLRDIIDLIVDDSNITKDTFYDIEKIREILKFQQRSSWWDRMDHTAVWEKIKTYIPSVSYNM
jgi:hypothetical protein